MAELVGSGFTPAQALRAMAEGTWEDGLRPALREAAEGLERSGDIAGAFQTAFPHTPPFCIERLGELPSDGAGLSAGLRELAAYMEDMEALEAQGLSASGIAAYPLFLLGFALIILMLLGVFVFPRVESLFTEFGVDLPAVTTGLFAISGFVVASLPVLLPVLVVVVALWLLPTPRERVLRPVAGRVLARLPGFGRVYRMQVAGQVARTIAFLGGNGDSPTRAAEACAQALTSAYARGELRKVVGRLQSGVQLPDALARGTLFDRRLVTAAGAGGQGEPAAPSFAFLCAQIQDRLRLQPGSPVARSLKMLVLLVVGGLIGLMVVGIYLPIFRTGGLV